MRFLKRCNAVYGWVIAVPILLMFLGAASNQAVLIANGGKFPILLNRVQQAAALQRGDAGEEYPTSFSPGHTQVVVDHLVLRRDDNPDGMLDDTHCVMSSSNHLKALADIFNFHSVIASIGDLMLMLGGFLWDFAPLVWGTLVIRKCLSPRGLSSCS